MFLGQDIIESIWGFETQLMLGTDTHLTRSTTNLKYWDRFLGLCCWHSPHSTWTSSGLSMWDTIRCIPQVPHLWARDVLHCGSMPLMEALHSREGDDDSH